MSKQHRGIRARLTEFIELEARWQPTAQAWQPAAHGWSDTAFEANQFLVSFNEQTPEHLQTERLQSLGTSITSESLGLGLHQVSIHDSREEAEIAERLQALPGVRSVGRNYHIEPQRLVPNDPSWQRSIHTANLIGLPAAWTTHTGTGSTIVAVIDSGLDTSHPDLAANLWRNPRETPGNGRDDDGNGFIDDFHGVDFTTNTNNLTDHIQHGTHVAGIIGAVGNNGLGSSGVNWQAQIMPLKFLGPNGGLTSNAVRALDYAITNGARIINLSWGGSPYDPSFAAALARARTAGVIIVASAGNYATNTDAQPFFPAAYSLQFDHVISVTATDDTGRLPSWANYGAQSVTVAMPGVNITSTLPQGRFGALSGTSMAAPFVSGALSLLWDAQPQLTAQQVLARFYNSIDTTPHLQGKVRTNGLLNVGRLLQSPPAPPANTTPPAQQPTPSLVVQAAQFTGTRPGQLDRIQLTFNRSVDANTLNRSTLSVRGPLGEIGISAVLPVSGSQSTRFTLMLSRPQIQSGSYELSIEPTVRSTDGAILDQNRNGRPGEPADRFTLTATLQGSLSTPAPPTTPLPPRNPTPPASTTREDQTRYNTLPTPRTVLPRRTTRVEFRITDQFRIEQLTVNMDLTHTRHHHLVVRLTAPNGQQITLHNRGPTLPTTNHRISFADAASQKPAQPLGSLRGMSALGVWVVELFDLGDGPSGTLRQLELVFTKDHSLS